MPAQAANSSRHSAPRAAALLLCLGLVLAWGALAQPARARTAARVPQGFLGTVVGDPLFPDLAQTPYLNQQFDLMVGSGVETVRAVFGWSQAQPYPSWSKVPASARADFSSDGVDAVPTDFRALDALVTAAAQRHLSVLPVVINAPGWDGQHFRIGVLDIPRHDPPYAAFCAALVRRYGPRGSFWKGQSHPRPITSWQIWNEPNVPAFWPPQPFVARYVSLLRQARSAIRRVDPKAKIILAGLANYSWTALRGIYQVPGARGLFDVVGVHPYTRTPQGVVTILQRARRIMRSYGDGAKPMIADEISWPSSLGKTVHNTGYDFATTEAGQARNLAAVLPLLAANRARLGLQNVYYYDWAEVEVRNALAFSYAGLLKFLNFKFVAKPALAAFRHAALGLEHCHTKGAVADVCVH